MQVGTPGQTQAQINMTPMIDILLVLIIIFLVINPPDTHGLPTAVPQEPQSTEPRPPDAETLVVTISAGPKYELNGQSVEGAMLPGRLKSILGSRARKELFVRGRKNLEYESVAAVIDIARGAGASQIGLLSAPE